MPDRAYKCNKLHINFLRYTTLESILTEEVVQNNINFGPDLFEGGGSKIAYPEISWKESRGKD